jgi:hypothetical protein
MSHLSGDLPLSTLQKTTHAEKPPYQPKLNEHELDVLQTTYEKPKLA